MAQYIEFTNEELERANSVSLVDYLSSRGERLVRSGREYRWIYVDGSGKHDSVTVRDNEWYDHKNQVGGKAIDFLRQKLGFTFKEAIQELIGMNAGAAPIFTPKPIQLVKPKLEFLLPQAKSDMHRVFAYLIKQRYLAPQVLSHFAHNKMLYEDKEFHNAVFVGFNKDGIPKHAHKRSTSSFGNTYRGTVEGSEPEHTFCHIGTSPKLFVYESPIDMLSYITSYQDGWQQHSYVALCGVAEHGIITRLKEYPHLQEVVLCLDNDIAGIDATDRLTDILHEMGCNKISTLSSRNKDWNEDLIGENGGIPKPSVPHRRKELFNETTEQLQYRKCTDLAQTASRIWNCYKDYCDTGDSESVKRLAEHSASAIGLIMQRTNSDGGCTSDYYFNLFRGQYVRDYRAYMDKGTSEQRLDQFRKAVRDVMHDLKDVEFRTPEDYQQTSEKLTNLCYKALGLYVDIQLNAAQLQEQSELEPMNLCL